jgi:hypothetical protein
VNCLSLNIRGKGDPAKENWIRGIKSSYGINFISLQDSKLQALDGFNLGRFWGRSKFEFEWVPSVGRSGGLISLWDPSYFSAISCTKSRSFLIIHGVLLGSGINLSISNVYGPNDLLARRGLWDSLTGEIQKVPNQWILMGDYNEVRGP